MGPGFILGPVSVRPWRHRGIVMKNIIRDFLGRLLPWKGTEETTWKSIWIRAPAAKDPNKIISWGHATQDLDELVEIAMFYARKPKREVYFGLGTQRVSKASEHGGKWQASIRTTNNMVSYKALWLDLDCGPTKEFKTKAIALEEIGSFCELAELPVPNQIVNSGNGLHVYWVTELPMPFALWTVFAQALDTATKKHGFPCDAVCTTDAARIFRVPGTSNWKTDPPNPVEMGAPGPEFSHAFLEQALKPYMGPQPFKGPRQQAFEHDELTKRFMDGLTPTHSEPVDLIALADAGCGVLGEAFDSAGKDHKQPLWHLLMLTATFDKDPRGAAHMMSDGYAGYDANEVEEMLARKQNERAAKNMGWPSCFSFSKLSPICQSCQFFADNKSPMHISLHRSAATADDDLPAGYVRNPMGQVCHEWRPTPKADPQLMPVLKNKMYGARLVEGSEDLLFKTEIGGEERTILIARDHTKPEAIIGALVNQSLFPHAIWHKQMIGPFIMAWMEKLHTLKLPKVAADVYGWGPEQTSFTYGGLTYGQGAPTKAFFRDASSFQYYEPCGRLDVWQAIAKALTDQQRPSMDAVLATAFGAPLVPFTGMPGLLFSAFSLLSGIGKSTSMKVAQAVWGHPLKGMNMLDDTTNAVMKKLSDVQSIPLMWDELKMRQEIDTFVALLFRLTQGRDKARLTREVMARGVGSFSTLMVCATNESLAEAMGRAVGSTDAGANRVFEIEVEQIPAAMVGSIGGWDRMIARLHSNYGRAAEMYVAWLARNQPYVKQIVGVVQNHFEAKVNGAPDERFWIATMSVVYAGATFANQLKLTNINLPALETFLFEQFDRQRATRKDSVTKLDTYDDAVALAHRLIAATRARNMIVTDYVKTGPGRPKKNDLHGDVSKLEKIWLQLGLTDDTLRFHRGEFDDWAKKLKLSPSASYKAFRTHLSGMAVFATLGVGVNHPLVTGALNRMQANLFEITLPSTVIQQAATGPDDATASSPLHSSSPAVPPGSP